MNDFTIRKASIRDAHQIWEIRNSLDVRKNSSNSAPIEYSSHLIWFQQYLRNPGNHIFAMKLTGDNIVGYCRYDYAIERFTASIAVATIHQSLGYGSTLLQRTLKLIEKEKLPVIAKVKIANLVSLKLFQKHEFVITESDSEYHYLTKFTKSP